MGTLSETASATPPKGGSMLRRAVLGGAAGVGEGTDAGGGGCHVKGTLG